MVKPRKSPAAEVPAHRTTERCGTVVPPVTAKGLSPMAAKALASGTPKTAAPAKKAVVLGATPGRGGQYLVLAPAAAPKHVSAAKLASAVRRVVAAR